MAQSLQTFLSRELHGNIAQVGIVFEHEFWDGKQTVIRGGGRIRLRKLFGNQEIGTDLTVNRISSLDQDRSHLSGTDTQLRLFAGLIHEPVYGQVFVDLEKHDSGDQRFSDGSVRPLAFKSWGPGLRVIWKIKSDWILTLQGSYLFRDYSALSEPGYKERHDSGSFLGFRLTHLWNRQLSSYFLLSHRSNRSTLAATDVWDENHSATTSLLGILWDVF